MKLITKEKSVFPASVSVEKNGWFSYDTHATDVIVFVHGFLSDPKCWLNENTAFWPQLLAEDSRLKNTSIFIASYHTDIDSGDYGVTDCANEILSILKEVRADGKRTPVDFKNIIFVCHSLGGIVVRYLLDSTRAVFRDKSIGLVLVASPSLGSMWADLLSGAANFFGNRQGKQLRQGSEFLIDLDNRFKRLLEDKTELKIVGMELAETRGFLHTKLIRFLPPIVNVGSAGRYFGNAIKISATNHSSIAKPPHREHASHRNLISFINEKFSPTRLIEEPIAIIAVESKKDEKLTLVNNLSRVLFEVYDNSCLEYYYRRQIDDDIEAALEMYSVWISGPSGSGKTSLIKHLVNKNDKKPVEISLSHLTNNLSAETCLSEIFETCRQLGIGGEYISGSQVTWLNKALADYSKKSSIVLYIDEVPLTEGDAATAKLFAEFIFGLLTAIKQRSAAGTNIVISSIQRPPLDWSGKLSEQLVHRELEDWSEPDIYKLYYKVISYVPDLMVNPEILPFLISSCKGSPRFLKTFLRNKSLYNLKIDDGEILNKLIFQLNGA